MLCQARESIFTFLTCQNTTEVIRSQIYCKPIGYFFNIQVIKLNSIGKVKSMIIKAVNLLVRRSLFGILFVMLTLPAFVADVMGDGSKSSKSLSVISGLGSDAQSAVSLSCMQRFESCNNGFMYKTQTTDQCVADALTCYGASSSDVGYLLSPDKARQEWGNSANSAEYFSLIDVCHETADRCFRLCNDTMFSNNSDQDFGINSALDMTMNCERSCMAQTDRCLGIGQ